jgi:predicted RNA-binding Zn-ribbon protein involved in translation (DUF1610 family)
MTMSDNALTPPVPLAVGEIAADLPCVFCGYNLRGLQVGGKCPECGAPIVRSVQGGLLCHADPRWLGKLLLGLTLLGWGTILWLALGPAVRVLDLSLLDITDFSYWDIASFLRKFLVAVHHALLPCVELLAYFLITWAKPGLTDAGNMHSLRKWVRACAVLYFLRSVVVQAIYVVPIPLPFYQMATGLLRYWGIAAVFLLFMYLERLAARLPNPKLMRSSRIVRWGLSLALAVFTTAGLVLAIASLHAALAARASWAPTSMPASRPSTQPIIAKVYDPTAVLGAVGQRVYQGTYTVAFAALCIFGIWYLVLVFKYRHAFRRVASEARQLSEGGVPLAPPPVSGSA